MAGWSERLGGIAAALASAIVGRRTAILMYHQVLERADPLRPGTPDAVIFDWQMRVLRECFTPLGLAEAAERLRDGRLPPRAVVVTFDDGYADNARVALPILRRWGVPATFFVATGFLNRGRMFNDTVIETVRRLPAGFYDASWLGLGALPLHDVGTRLAAIESMIRALKYRPLAERGELVGRLAAASPSALPDDLMMTSEELIGLERSGMSVGGHTRHHPILAELPAEAARQEVVGGREDLESLLGHRVRLFAYPNGRPGRDYRDEHRAIVAAAGFDCAVSTAWAAAGQRSDPLQLPRVSPLGATAGEFAVRLARAYLNAG